MGLVCSPFSKPLSVSDVFFFSETNTLTAFLFLTYPEWILVCEAVASKYMVLEMVLWSFIHIIFIYLFGWVFDAVGAFL